MTDGVGPHCAHRIRVSEHGRTVLGRVSGLVDGGFCAAAVEAPVRDAGSVEGARLAGEFGVLALVRCGVAVPALGETVGL